MDLNTKLLSTTKLFSRENDIIQWGIDRNIVGNTAQGTFEGQQKKTNKEWEEWKEFQSKDDIGDIFVTVVMGAALQGTTISDVVKGSCNYVADENFIAIDSKLEQFQDLDTSVGFYTDENVKYLKVYFELSVLFLVVALHATADKMGWTLEECIEVSWDDIKDRKGLMYNGAFIKESNLNLLADLGITFDSDSGVFKGEEVQAQDIPKVDELFESLDIQYTSDHDSAKNTFSLTSK